MRFFLLFLQRFEQFNCPSSGSQLVECSRVQIILTFNLRKLIFKLRCTRARALFLIVKIPI